MTEKKEKKKNKRKLIHRHYTSNLTISFDDESMESGKVKEQLNTIKVFSEERKLTKEQIHQRVAPSLFYIEVHRENLEHKMLDSEESEKVIEIGSEKND